MATTIVPMLAQPARDLVKRHQDQGHLCALVTATNSFVTGPDLPRAQHPAPDRHHPGAGQRPVHRANRAARQRSAKADHARRELARSDGTVVGQFRTQLVLQRLRRTTCRCFCAVSDPVAVDPDQTLRAHAEAAGWTIPHAASITAPAIDSRNGLSWRTFAVPQYNKETSNDSQIHLPCLRTQIAKQRREPAIIGVARHGIRREAISSGSPAHRRNAATARLQGLCRRRRGCATCWPE